jgi:hypothetical protein
LTKNEDGNESDGEERNSKRKKSHRYRLWKSGSEVKRRVVKVG